MEQFRTVEDLREYIKKLGPFYARPTEQGAHPTLYRNSNDSSIIFGVRKRDYLFSQDERWVLPHPEMGLSFSAHWQHLKRIYKMKKKVTRGASIDVFWVIEKADIPSGLAFVADPKDENHYLLAVTERMRIETLAEKLTWVADRMSVIREAQEAL
ncbi:MULTISPECIES: hypothetical protein [unclassified Microbulbifer]|uniref:hypothetical protein n=1 Tax=unclassified Microbulbifer TaxID=2619833 RepID=UPI0027E55662|nr:MULTISPECIES: hypothetical protein [unclassified Microbulbifer]